MRSKLLLLLTLTVSLVAEKNWKDQQEYELYSAAVKAADPASKLTALNTWKEKYPQTDYQQERLAQYLIAFEQAKDLPHMLETLYALDALNPSDAAVMKGIMLLVISPQNTDTSAAALDRAEGIAKTAVSNPTLEALAHTTLGWIAMRRKNNEAAEQEFTQSLRREPSAQVILWLSDTLRGQKKISEALFYAARAAVYEGPGAFPPESRKQVEEYLRKLYKSHHGADDAGLAELKKLAAAQPAPPEGFAIKSAQQIADEFREQNKELTLWMDIKKELTGPEGRQYFETQMKDAEIPKLKGTVVSARLKKIMVALSNNETPEATLVLDAPLAKPLKPGTTIEFVGIAEQFTADPFMVTFAVSKSKLKL